MPVVEPRPPARATNIASSPEPAGKLSRLKDAVSRTAFALSGVHRCYSTLSSFVLSLVQPVIIPWTLRIYDINIMATKNYALSEVADHKSRDDLWIVVQGKGQNSIVASFNPTSH
jgi:cytochrome b involved in lipid metabolism